MMADTCELALSVERATLNRLVDAQERERRQLTQQTLVLSLAASGVPRLQQERQAHAELPRLDPRGYLISTLGGKRRGTETRPR
jgi:hypothetical protein